MVCGQHIIGGWIYETRRCETQTSPLQGGSLGQKRTLDGESRDQVFPCAWPRLTCQPQAEDRKFLMCKAVGLSLRSPFYFKILSCYVHLQTSQVALMVKNHLPMQVDIRDPGSTPGSGRSPGEGHGNPLHYACLESLMDREAWRATAHRVAKNQTQPKQQPSMHTCQSSNKWRVFTLKYGKKSAYSGLF